MATAPLPAAHQSPEHVVQLFDTIDSRANVVSAYLAEGWRQGRRLLVLARPAHWARTAERLERRGCPVAVAAREHRLAVFDAATTLAAMMRGDGPDPELFDQHVASQARRLAAGTSQPLCVYGELVDILAEQGDLGSATTLELFWNDLAAHVPLTLLCGYSAAHFSDLRTAAALHAICRAHTRVQTNTSDMLGKWLVAR